MAEKAADIKIVTVGDGAVGKTSFLIVFAKKEFPNDYIPTVYDDYTADYTVGNRKITLSLWDTAGQEEYDAIRPLSYDQTNIFFLTFSTTSRQTLESIKNKWMVELRDYYKGKRLPMIMLVGTKSDLRDSSPDHVTDEEITKAMHEIGAVDFAVCSAKMNQGVDEVFETALHHYFDSESQHEGCCSIL